MLSEKIQLISILKHKHVILAALLVSVSVDFSEEEEYVVVRPPITPSAIVPAPTTNNPRHNSRHPASNRPVYRHQKFPRVRLYRLVSLYLIILFIALEVGVYMLSDYFCHLHKKMCMRLTVGACVILTIVGLIVACVFEYRSKKNKRQIIMDFVTKGEA